eukprot:453842-Pyramimonas_sp.AAC.1
MPLKEIGRAVPYFRCKPLRRENRCAIVTRADFNKPMGVEAPRNLEAVIEAEGGEFLLGSALMGAHRAGAYGLGEQVRRSLSASSRLQELISRGLVAPD